MAGLKVGVLVSGFGSNLQTLIDLCADPSVPAEILSVISNKPGVKALERAALAGIPAAVIRHQDYPDRDSFDAAIERVLLEAGVEFICLAGFMRVLSAGFVERWRDRMINIHPSLLPAFKGVATHAQALAAGVKIHGCTVHIVRPDLDAGPIIVQAAVPILSDDDEDRLAARVHQAEHRAYPLALRLFAEGRVRISGEHVTIDNAAAAPSFCLINPSDLPNRPA